MLPKLGQTKGILINDSLFLPKKKGISIGILGTTNGLGLQISRQIGHKNKLALKLSGTYFLYPIKNLLVTIDGKNIYFFGNSLFGTKLLVNGEIQLGSANLMLDYHPFKNAFKISTGFALLFSQLNFIATPRDSLKQGDISIAPEEQGNIYYGLKTQLACPYLGIGLGRAIPKKRVNLNFEIGVYYVGAPKLNFKTTGMLEPTSLEEAKLKDNIKNYQLLPVISLTLNIKLTK
jgi:hypothetical protein